MHLLLPPSETKRSGGGSAFAVSSLAHQSRLRTARAGVRAALIDVSRDEETAAKALKLGAKNRAERLHNLRLARSGAMPAIDRYTGVLYDALDASTLPLQAREWLAAHVSVQSALFGLVRAGDPIPAYRLSASSRLPALEHSLKRVWAEAHAAIDWRAFGWVLDLRSKDYAQLAPLPAGAGAALQVAQRGESGEVRALNHFNKAAKGDLVRRLAIGAPQIDGAEDLLRWAQHAGLEMTVSPDGNDITLITTLGVPGASVTG